MTSSTDRKDSQTRTYDRSKSVVFLKTKEEFGGLSNMAGGFPLKVNGLRILTSEALYQACRFPHRPELQRLIIGQNSPMTAKMKSKPYRSDSRPDWDQVRVKIMRWCLRVKLAQNWAKFSRLLLSTGDRPIVEESRKDDFWGAYPVDNRTLVGRNILGRLLMELRESIRTGDESGLRRVEPPPIANFLLNYEPVGVVISGPESEARQHNSKTERVETPPAPRPVLVQASFFDQPLPAEAHDLTPQRECAPLESHALEPYPRYVDSTVEWLGQVPEGWDVFRIKNLARLQSGDNITAFDINKSGEYPVYGGNGVRGFTSAYTHEGEYVLIGRQGALCGNINYARGRFWASEHAVVAHPRREFDTYWFGELLRFMNLNQYSISAAQPGLAVERIQNLWLPVPPSGDQAAISRFLGHVDRPIRRYIRAKQNLIALLNEQKQVIVHRAVTCGLDPAASLKPSGMDWVGDIPEHWVVQRNGQLFIQRNETGYADLPILEVSLRTGVRIRNFDSSDRKQVMSDRSQYKRAAKGDIAYNMMRMWQGAVGVAPEDGLVSPAYVVARPLPGTDPRYYAYLFRTSTYMSEVDKYSRGIVKDRNRLYWEGFKQMPSPYPPYSEQVQIADAIDRDTATINSVIEQITQQIALVREYRTRLIADVVTGKLDVRAVAAALPDEPEEPDDTENLEDEEQETEEPEEA